jgi:peroxiredoxin Q/BCP
MKILFFLSFITGLIFPQELHLKAGMDAPDFSLEDAHGIKYSLQDYKDESPVVIYFYPKAGTSGCTKQACGIRDSYKQFEELTVAVFGISTDSKEDIRKFVDQYQLNFPLLSDSTKEISRSYGVLKENGLSARYTFIIDKSGKIFDIIEVKDVTAHSSYVLEKLKEVP